VVADLVGSLTRNGFRRVVLLPTHGGNFAPLAAAIEKLDAAERERVVAITDLGVLLQIAQIAADEFGVPLPRGGLHGGEWETSLLMAIHPELVRMDRAEPGFVGDLGEAIQGMFAGGVKSITDVGVIGDPAEASADHGRRYWEAVLDLAEEAVSATD
jgi:creatinine amidohydrolase